jgi:glycerol kinase
LLYDIHKCGWSSTICSLFDIPMQMLPEVRDCAADFGMTRPDLFGREIPVRGVAGDQQAATMGQACFAPGMLKSTYGTGCFALLNTGDAPVTSQNRLLTTIAYQFDGRPTYALEGSIFIAGAVVQWLRDGLKIIREAKETQPLAAQADPQQNVVLVPAFTGLGAPYWNAECRGAVFGLSRNSGPAELARAALESVGYQTRDLLEAMNADWQAQEGKAALRDRFEIATLRVDGGMSASDWAMQFLADIIDAPVDRPAVRETTALGVAWLAGMQAGLYPDRDGFSRAWALERTFKPAMQPAIRDAKYAAWKRAVAATLSF